MQQFFRQYKDCWHVSPHSVLSVLYCTGLKNQILCTEPALSCRVSEASCLADLAGTATEVWRRPGAAETGPSACEQVGGSLAHRLVLTRLAATCRMLHLLHLPSPRSGTCIINKTHPKTVETKLSLWSPEPQDETVHQHRLDAESTRLSCCEGLQPAGGCAQ